MALWRAAAAVTRFGGGIGRSFAPAASLVPRRSSTVDSRVCDVAGVDLYDPALTYGDLPTADIVRAVAVLKATQSGFVVKHGPRAFEMAQRVPVVRGVVNAVARATFFRQFCGGETLEQCRSFTERLSSKGITCIFDYSAEAPAGEESEAQDEGKFAYSAGVIRDTIHFAASNPASGFSCVKVTGLTRFGLLEKVTDILYRGDPSVNLREVIENFDANRVPGLAADETDELMRAFGRLDSLCEDAARLGVPMLIDAEQYQVQGAIDLFAMLMQQRYNRERPYVYTTVQAYLKNAPARVGLLRELASAGPGPRFQYAVKQVRGAYMTSERARAAEQGYASPICDLAEHTHHQYDDLASVLLEDVAHERGAVMFATHNARSLKHIAQECARLGVERSAPLLHIAQLYGMGDSLTMGMVSGGYNAAKYVPFGPIDEVMPYLTRRLEENNDALSGAPRDIKMFMEVLAQRDLLPRL